MATASLADEPFLIGGKWIAPAERERFDVLDPADGQPFARAIQASAADVDAAVAAAAAAHADGRWRIFPPEDRARVLIQVAELIEERLEDLAVLETRDNGKPIERSRADTAMSARAFRHFAARRPGSRARRSRSPATTSTRGASRSASPPSSCPGTSRS